MSKYIDREAFQAALVRKQCGAANRRYTEGWNDCLLRVKSMVSKFPPAEITPNYERMWNSLKRELQQLEEHYSDMRLNYAQKGQPTLSAHFKERGDGVAEAIMYMDLAEDDAFDE